MSVDFNVADIFKLPVKIFAAIAIGTAIILFLPDSVIQKLYLTGFRNSFGFVIGIAFVISVSIVGVTIVIAIYQTISRKVLFSRSKRSREKCLNQLDSYQKTIVYSLYEEMNHTDELPIHDGSVIWLEQNMIIGKAASQHFIENLANPEFPYMLQPWAVAYLNEHMDLLNDFKNTAEQFIKSMEAEANRNASRGYW